MLLGNYRMKIQGIDFEFLIANFKQLTIPNYLNYVSIFEIPWLSNTLAGPYCVGLVRNLFIAYLVICASIGLVICQYSADYIFEFITEGTIYAF